MKSFQIDNDEEEVLRSRALSTVGRQNKLRKRSASSHLRSKREYRGDDLNKSNGNILTNHTCNLIY